MSGGRSWAGQSCPLGRGLMGLGFCSGLFPHPPQPTMESEYIPTGRGARLAGQTLLLLRVGFLALGEPAPGQIKTPDASRCRRCLPWLPPAPQEPQRRETPSTPFPGELSPPEPPSIFEVACQSPSPGGFLAQVGHPGGEGRSKGPHGLLGPKAFGDTCNVPQPSEVLKSRSEGQPPREETRGLAGGVAGAGRTPEAWRGRHVPPPPHQLPLRPFLFVLL